MNAKPLDLAALQAICEAAGETIRQEAIAAGTLLPVWDDVRGVIEIDPLTGKEPTSRKVSFGISRTEVHSYIATKIVTSAVTQHDQASNPETTKVGADLSGN
jgi:hypothetical protein